MLTGKSPGIVTVLAAYATSGATGQSSSAWSSASQTLSSSAQVTIGAAPAGAEHNRSPDHMEHPGSDPIWYSIEQCSIGRDGECARSLRLYSDGWDGSQSRSTNPFRRLRSGRHEDLFCRYRICATHGHEGPAHRHLVTRTRHHAGNCPQRRAVGRCGQCTRYPDLQSGSRHRALIGTPATHGYIFAGRRRQLHVGYCDQLTHRGRYCCTKACCNVSPCILGRTSKQEHYGGRKHPAVHRLRGLLGWISSYAT